MKRLKNIPYDSKDYETNLREFNRVSNLWTPSKAVNQFFFNATRLIVAIALNVLPFVLQMALLILNWIIIKKT